MVTLKTRDELLRMQKAGALTAAALWKGGESIRPGMTTRQLDRIIHDYIVSHGAKPSFLGYGGFPGSACISVNDEVIHGIPGDRVLQEGDIVSIDVGAYLGGYHGDSAYTFCCGEVAPDTLALLETTRLSLQNGIAQAVAGNRIGDISAAVQQTVEACGYSVVREYVGHGVGKDLHEAPEVPNYGKAGHGVRLAAGMVIAIEPMINAGRCEVRVLENDWTVVTRDHSMSAHFEHTVAIAPSGPPVILTARS